MSRHQGWTLPPLPETHRWSQDPKYFCPRCGQYDRDWNLAPYCWSEFLERYAA